MASLRTNGSDTVLRRRRKISIDPESTKDGENSELSISEIFNVPLVSSEPDDAESKKDGEIDSESIIFKFQSGFFEPDAIKWKEPKKPKEKPEEAEKPPPPMPTVEIDLEHLCRSCLRPSKSFPPFLQKQEATLLCYSTPFLQHEKNVSEQNEDEAVTGNNFQESSDSYHLEWNFIGTNLFLEILIVVLDQKSSPQKPGYALTAFAVSTFAIFVSLLDLYLKARRQGVALKREGLRFRFDYSSSTQKQFCNFTDAFGLICAFTQFIFSGVAYSYHRRHADNPVNFFVVNLIFIVCVAICKIHNEQVFAM